MWQVIQFLAVAKAWSAHAAGAIAIRVTVTLRKKNCFITSLSGLDTISTTGL
jgi:hypothetical protein